MGGEKENRINPYIPAYKNSCNRAKFCLTETAAVFTVGGKY